MNITLEYQNKKKKEINGSNNNLVQENRNSKQIGWLTLNDITCHSYHMNIGINSALGASPKHRIDRSKISTYFLRQISNVHPFINIMYFSFQRRDNITNCFTLTGSSDILN